MNNDLLDDRTIEVELSGRLLMGEIKPIGKWLLITATISLLIGALLFLIGFLVVFFDEQQKWRVLFGLLLLSTGVSLLGLGGAQFRYLRAIHWQKEDTTSYQVDNLFETNLLVWKWIAIFLGVALIVLLFILQMPSYVI